jgi:hypothetical protein
MNIETLVNNDEYKIIFLKAILLGINYGKSNNAEFYMNNIKGEVDKIYNKLNNPNIIKYNNIIKKSESQIINLEYQKSITLSNIQKLSHSHYGFNHSKINLLKITLQNIQIEIERLKFNIKKTKDLIDNLNKTDNNNIINNQQNRENSNQLYSNINNQQNRNIINNQQTRNNSTLVGELEKTLDNLSNLFS